MKEAHHAQIEHYCGSFGLEFSILDDNTHRLKRHKNALILPSSILERISTQTTEGRFAATWILFGVRLGLDQIAFDYEPSMERPVQKKTAYRTHEVPSIYGTRIPWLVPTLTSAWVSAITTPEELWIEPWISPDFHVLHILETGKFLHILSTRNLTELEPFALPIDKLTRDARAALFYDSYRVKPRRRINSSHGKLRVYETSEGLGASRALLLPEFDYDAAQEQGFFSIPSRHTLIVAEPAGPDHRLALKEELHALTHQTLRDSSNPLSRQIFRMYENSVSIEQDSVDATAPKSLPLDNSAVLPPQDLTIISDG